MPAPIPPGLPADDHTHTEWSWDAHEGSMVGACERAVELGLPSIAFTEHVDRTRWPVPAEVRGQLTRDRDHVGEDGWFTPPPLDVAGYLAAVDECRERFPQLKILAGVELGEPHWFAEQTRDLVAGGDFDRVLGSLHSLKLAGDPWLVDMVDPAHAPGDLNHADLLRAYLVEAARMVRSFPDAVQVLGHIDYPVRRWPVPFDPSDFEEELRQVLTALAAQDRALEVNTRIPLASEIVGWWRDVGGRAVSFGSDAHRPDAVAAGFSEAAAMVESHGFRPDRHPHGFWHR